MRTVELSNCREPLFSICLPYCPLAVTRFDGCMCLLLATLVSIEIPLARLVQLRIPPHPTALLPWYEIAALTVSVVVCCWYPIPRFVEAAKCAVWSGVFVGPLCFLVQLAGRSHYRLVDKQLARVDWILNVNTAAIHHAVANHSVLYALSVVVYVMFTPIAILATVAPCLCGYESASRKFILGVVIGVILGAMLFAVIPAAGPWTTELMSPSPIQATMTHYLLRLKSQYEMNAVMANSAIVSFPSEHVLVALLGAETLAVVRFVRYPARIVGVLICISTITTGWHYGIDVLGGLVVAWVSREIAAYAYSRMNLT